MNHSYSSINDFDTCPRKYAEIRIWRNFKAEFSQEKDFGKRVHEAFEHFIGKGKPLADEFVTLQGVMDFIQSVPGNKEVEKKLAISRNGFGVDYWDKSAFLRGQLDLVVTGPNKTFAVDYKSGGDKFVSWDQLELAALLIFLNNPEVHSVRGVLLYFTTGSVLTKDWTRDDTSKLWDRWVGKTADIENAIRDQNFPEKSSGLCKGYCPVTSCQHWDVKRRKA